MSIEMETMRLLSLFRMVSLDGWATKTNLDIKSDGIKMMAPLDGNQVMINAEFSKKFFLSYDVQEERTIGIDCARIIGILKTVRDNKVELSFDENNLYVKGETTDLRSPLKTSEEKEYPVKIIDTNFGAVFVREGVDEEEWKNSYSSAKIPIIPTPQLDPLNINRIFFEIENNYLRMVQEDKGGTKIRKQLSDKVENSVDKRILCSVEYIKYIMKSFSHMSTEVNVALAKDNSGVPRPIVFNDKSEEHKISVAVAPMQEEED